VEVWQTYNLRRLRLGEEKQVAHLSQRDRATHELLRFAKLRSGIFEAPFWGLRGNVRCFICTSLEEAYSTPYRWQELIRRWDSERELLRSAPGRYPNSLKQRKITPLRRSRSFKVTDFGTNRKLIYDFLLVINCNLPSVLHRFRDIAVDRSEIAIFGYPLVFNSPGGGVPLGRSP